MKLEPSEIKSRITMLFKDKEDGKEYIVYSQHTGCIHMKEVGTENTTVYNGEDLERIISILKKATDNTFLLVDKVYRGEPICSENGLMY
jgi:hypothetical protein